ncbi:cutinase family protein [Mycobacterium intracellulare]|nr:cutinase family protein [Mycobacterium intracellulare]
MAGGWPGHCNRRWCCAVSGFGHIRPGAVGQGGLSERPTDLRPRHRRAAGLGVVGDALFAALQPALGSRTVDSYAVNYPASYNFLTTADAANDARDHIAEMVDQCPSTRLVLGGFSQGAAAISMLAGVPPVGQRIGNFGSAPPLDPALANKIRAVAVFGNPGNRFDTPLSSTGAFAGRTIDLCSEGDPVCVVGGRDRDAHHDYSAPPYPGQAASFIAGLV